MKEGFRWTGTTVCVTRPHNGNGVEANYWVLGDHERPAWVPEGIPVGLKVYKALGEAGKVARDQAYRVQKRLARRWLAPEVYARVKVYRADGPMVGEFIGFGLITEHVIVWRKVADENPKGVWDANRARRYLTTRIPGCERDLHEGNYGWNPRRELPQFIDCGPIGVEQVVKKAKGKAGRMAAHARRKARGMTRCGSCDAKLR